MSNKPRRFIELSLTIEEAHLLLYALDDQLSNKEMIEAKKRFVGLIQGSIEDYESGD